jgi:hypothetical protein
MRRRDVAQFQEAFELAVEEAAALIAPHVNAEPMRSVLHRGNGSLALNCDEYRIAEKLLAVGWPLNRQAKSPTKCATSWNRSTRIGS